MTSRDELTALRAVLDREAALGRVTGQAYAAVEQAADRVAEALAIEHNALALAVAEAQRQAALASSLDASLERVLEAFGQLDARAEKLSEDLEQLERRAGRCVSREAAAIALERPN